MDAAQKEEKKGKKSKRSVLLVVVIIVLVACLVVLAVLWAATQSKGYYEAKCTSFEVQNANLSKGQIIFVGDSITDGYHLDDYYADLPLATYNRGINGDTTQGVLARMQVSLYDLEPSKVVLMIGTNDVNGRKKNDYILKNYETILSGIKEHLPACDVVCVSVIPQNKQLEINFKTSVADNNVQIRALNVEIEKLCEAKGYTYVDLNTAVSDEDGMLLAAYSDDGIHLNGNGFVVWTQLVKPYLQ